MRVNFSNVRLGEMFNFNGTTYIKKSTRTALCMAAPRTFYFSQTDVCKI